MRLAPLVLLALLFQPLALARDEPSFFDLGPDPLADAVRAMEPKGLPEAGALDALATTTSAHGVTKERSRDVDLDEETVLHAIPLSRASRGEPFTINDLANLDDASTRVSTDERLIDLERGDVFAALLLSTQTTRGTVNELISTQHRWSTSDRTTQRVALAEEETVGGLAFLARGIPIDPRELVSIDVEAQGGSRTRAIPDLATDPRLTQTTSLPRETALAAATVLDANGAIEPLDLANATLRTSDNGALTRTSRLPESIVLSALALHANGIAVDGSDTLSLDETKRVHRIGETEINLASDTVTHALLLGAHA